MPPYTRWMRFAIFRWLVAGALMAVTLPAFARSDNDRVTFGSDVTVAADQSVDDVACAFCRVRVHGEVKGDVAVLFGSIMVDSGHTVSGDVAALGGDLDLSDGATVDGDVAIIAGDANVAKGATIRGDRTVLPGREWLLIPLAPFLILAGLIWLVVWLVRRNRYLPPVYPRRPGF